MCGCKVTTTVAEKSANTVYSIQRKRKYRNGYDFFIHFSLKTIVKTVFIDDYNMSLALILLFDNQISKVQVTATLTVCGSADFSWM